MYKGDEVSAATFVCQDESALHTGWLMVGVVWAVLAGDGLWNIRTAVGPGAKSFGLSIEHASPV